MSFLDGFTDEMIKTARGGLSRIIGRGVKKGGRAAARRATKRTRGQMSVSKGLALGAGGGAAGLMAGTTRGKEKGYKAGTGDTMQVAQRARLVGRKEGVLAYHRALMQARRRAQG